LAKVAGIDAHRLARRPVRPRRLVVSGAGAIVLVCVALASPVFAFASRSTLGVVVRKNGSGSVTTTCPGGEHVAFGGVVAQFRPPPNVPDRPLVFPEGMRRTAPDRWTVDGQSDTKGVGSRLSAVAYCDFGPAPLTAAHTVTLQAGRAGSAIATCPAGTVVLGGGFKSGASPQHMELIAQLERGSSTQWRVTLRNISKFATTLTALAYCGRGTTPTEYSSTISLARDKGGTARANCPAGMSLAFGGVVVTSPGSGAAAADLEAFSLTAASTKQWVVSGYNAGNSAGTVEALAYCR
jgi:hypothetical protein